jgi:hypothetical protein
VERLEVTMIFLGDLCTTQARLKHDVTRVSHRAFELPSSAIQRRSVFSFTRSITRAWSSTKHWEHHAGDITRGRLEISGQNLARFVIRVIYLRPRGLDTTMPTVSAVRIAALPLAFG